MFEKSGSDLPVPPQEYVYDELRRPTAQSFDIGPSETLITPSERKATDQLPENYNPDVEVSAIRSAQQAAEVLQGEPAYPESCLRIAAIDAQLENDTAQLNEYISRHDEQLVMEAELRIGEFWSRENRYPTPREERAIYADALLHETSEATRPEVSVLVDRIHALTAEMADLQVIAQPHVAAERKRIVASLGRGLDWEKVLEHYTQPEYARALVEVFSIMEPANIEMPLWWTAEAGMRDTAFLHTFGKAALEKGFVAPESLPQEFVEMQESPGNLWYEVADWLQETTDLLQYLALERAQNVEAAIHHGPLGAIVDICSALSWHGPEDVTDAVQPIKRALRRYAHGLMEAFDGPDSANTLTPHHEDTDKELEIRRGYLLTMAFDIGHVQEWFSKNLARHQPVGRTGGVHAIEIIEGQGPVRLVDKGGVEWREHGYYDSETRTVYLYLDAREIHNQISTPRRYGNEADAQRIRQSYLNAFLKTLHHEGAHHDHMWEWTIGQLRAWYRLDQDQPIDVEPYITHIKNGQITNANSKLEDVACSIGRYMTRPASLSSRAHGRFEQLREWYGKSV